MSETGICLSPDPVARTQCLVLCNYEERIVIYMASYNTSGNGLTARE